MVQVPQRQLSPTRQEELRRFLLSREDDTEDAPWMTMGDLQFWSASGFAHSLRAHGWALGLGWYVASMMPIRFTVDRSRPKQQLAPDVFVAFVPERARQSFDVEAEGGFPPFVLEVVSPSSADRDVRIKRDAYDGLGAREYAIFTPRDGRDSILAGYRRGAAGGFEPWPPDDAGRLWSATLNLFLTARGPLVRAQTPEGLLLPTPEEAVAALRDADVATRAAETARRGEAAARQRAEDEVARLRRELARYRGPEGE